MGEKMSTVETQLYKFSELSDDAKERAREKWREVDELQTDFLYEQFETAAGILGIDITVRKTRRNKENEMVAYTENTIQWSGFWSQGDGASFTGRFRYVPGCTEAIRKEFPTATTLHEIADALMVMQCTQILKSGSCAPLSGNVTHSGREVHKYSMDATLEDSEGEELAWDDPLTKKFLELMRDFADWIYNSLEKEYEYQTSDEAVDESIEAGEYDFDEEGNM
jgi:hypothetical protein